MAKAKPKIRTPKYKKNDERIPIVPLAKEAKIKTNPSALVSANSNNMKRMHYREAASWTAQVITNIPYTPQDYVYFEDAWSWTLAGLAIDKKMDFVIGRGINPTIDLINKANMSEEELTAEAKKYEYVIDKLKEIDTKPAINMKQTIYDAARMAKVFGRAVLAFEYGVESNQGVPLAVKIIHPRDLGRVQVNEIDWTVMSVINYMGMAVGESNVVNAEDMIYLVNAPNNPMRRNLFYGHSEMQRVVGVARAMRRVLEYDIPEIVEAMWAGYGLFLVDPEGKSPSDVQAELGTLLSNLSPGTFGAVSGRPNEKIQFIPLSLQPNVDGVVKLIDVFERLMIGNQGVPAALLGREEDSNMACYSEDTLTLTENGWKYYNEIGKDEKIATYNPETKEIEYHIPDGFALYDYEGDMIHIKNKNQDILVTPNHTMWFTPYHDKQYHQWQKCRADELENQREINFIGTGQWVGKETEYHNLNKVIYHGGVGHVQVEKIKMDTWLEFLGYYISEGFRSPEGNTAYYVGITQKSGWKNDKIKKCVDQLPYSYYDNINTAWDVHSYRFSNKQLAENLHDTGFHCETKQIPRWILHTVSKRQLNILFEALMLGDGHVNKNGGKVYFTTSQQLAQDVQELALKIGYHATIRTHYEAGYGNPNRQKAYRVFITKRTLKRVQKTSIKKIPYKGKVYCFGVKNHLFITMRNGCPTIQGNTLFGKIRLFLAGPVAQDREWLGNIMDNQWYAPLLKKLFPDLVGKIKIKTEFEPIITESWVDNIDALQKLSITIPQLPPEKLLEMVGLDSYKNDLEPDQATLERIYKDYPPSPDQVKQMYNSMQQPPVAVPDKKDSEGDTVPEQTGKFINPENNTPDVSLKNKSKAMKRDQMAQGSTGPKGAYAPDEKPERKDATIGDVQAWWDKPNVSMKQHYIDPNDWEPKRTYAMAKKPFKDLNQNDKNIVIRGFQFRNENFDVTKLLGIDIPDTDCKDVQRWWDVPTPSMRQHYLDPGKVLTQWSTPLARVDYADLDPKQKEVVKRIYEFRNTERVKSKIDKIDKIPDDIQDVVSKQPVKTYDQKKAELLDRTLDLINKVNKNATKT